MAKKVVTDVVPVGTTTETPIVIDAKDNNPNNRINAQTPTPET